MMTRVGTELGLMGNRVKRKFRNGKSAFTALQTNMAEGTRRAARKTDYFVHDNAWKLLGVAVGAAFFGGFLLARRATATEPLEVDERTGKVRRAPAFSVGEFVHSIIPLAVLLVKTKQAAKGRRIKV
jgi:hypothetical protein